MIPAGCEDARAIPGKREAALGKTPAVLFALTAVVLLWPIVAGANSIHVTSGFVDGGGGLGLPMDAEDLRLFGSGFDITSALEDEVAFIRFKTVPTVRPGALADFSAVLNVEDRVAGHLNDVSMSVSAPFKLSFDVSPTRLACQDNGFGTLCTGRAPFTLEAELTLTPFGGVPAVHRLFGAGTAEGRLFKGADFATSGVTYVFGPSAVPEPASLSVFTAAFALGAALLRRRRMTGR